MIPLHSEPVPFARCSHFRVRARAREARRVSHSCFASAREMEMERAHSTCPLLPILASLPSPSRSRLCSLASARIFYIWGARVLLQLQLAAAHARCYKLNRARKRGGRISRITTPQRRQLQRAARAHGTAHLRIDYCLFHRERASAAAGDVSQKGYGARNSNDARAVADRSATPAVLRLSRNTPPQQLALTRNSWGGVGSGDLPPSSCDYSLPWGGSRRE